LIYVLASLTHVGFPATRKIHGVSKIGLFTLFGVQCDLRTKVSRKMPPRSIPWMAPNGAKQGQASDSSKRKREVVDLTNDETRSTPKTSRTSSTRTPSQSQGSAGPSSAGARDRSFARTPSWTQPSPSSQRSRTAQVPPWTPPQQHSQAERDAWLQEEDNEIFENVDSSQSAPVAHEQYQKYGSLDTKIVGVRFYTGFATVGERITIKREPSNPYDSNASKLSKERFCKSSIKLISPNRQHGE
jgi:SWI/SNF-related matrix-associated actin-dependent regulator of chromatin subfamily A3